ncbi:MAG: stage III sporulation protein AB [Clostridia bacterium]|nr:stage III sporulation protein AB [Clostridia bacterium]
MKYVCIAVLCVSVIVAGKMFAGKYRRELKNGEAFLLFLSFAKSELLFCHSTVLEIVQKYARLHPHTLPFLESLNEPLSESVKEKLKRESALKQKQKELIADFFGSFGMQDAQGGEQLIERYMLLFNQENEALRKENENKIKLIERLSILLAAGVAIILF